jgi:hypothetical protein
MNFNIGIDYNGVLFKKHEKLVYSFESLCTLKENNCNLYLISACGEL